MGVEGRIPKGQNYRELCKLTVDIEEIEHSQFNPFGIVETYV